MAHMSHKCPKTAPWHTMITWLICPITDSFLRRHGVVGSTLEPDQCKNALVN